MDPEAAHTSKNQMSAESVTAKKQGTILYIQSCNTTHYLTRTTANSSLLQLKTLRLLAPQKHSHKPEEQRLKYLLLRPLNTKQLVLQLNNQVNSMCNNFSLALLVIPSLLVNFISTLQTFREIRAENPFFPHLKKLLTE